MMQAEWQSDCLEYYRSPGVISDPGEWGDWLDGLPADLADLSRVLQGLLIHILEARRYGVELPEERKAEIETGRVAGMIRRLIELDPRPFLADRPPERRLVATCHGYALLMCAALHRQGRPARARPGFAAYLMPKRFIDHWVCEYWESDRKQWVTVDAQLDAVERQAYGISFDACDVPSDQLVLAGRAWQEARAGRVDPQRFGFARWWGWSYLRHQVLRDLFALNKVELLPWSRSGLAEKDDQNTSEGERAMVDRIAALAVAADGALPELRSMYGRVIQLGNPPDWSPWRPELVRMDAG
jgi:hypothetical protein